MSLEIKRLSAQHKGHCALAKRKRGDEGEGGQEEERPIEFPLVSRRISNTDKSILYANIVNTSLSDRAPQLALISATVGSTA